MPRATHHSLGLVVACTFLIAPATVAAKSWGKITKAERALTSVPWYPEAPAVILLHKTAIHLTSHSEEPSRREELVRLKVLTEAGVKFGTIDIPSNEFMRMKHLDARVVLPDQRQIPLGDDAVFDKKYSSYYDSQMTSVVLPEVVPGAIIEWKYTLFFDSAVRTWEVYFENELPTLEREVLFHKPDQLEFRVGWFEFFGREPVGRIDDTRTGTIVVYRLRDLLPLPDEPFRPPYVDLATRADFIPVAFRTSRAAKELARSWSTLVKLIEDERYRETRKRSRAPQELAGRMTVGTGDIRSRANLLYRFVRDEIATRPSVYPITAGRPLDAVLRKRVASRAEKALILQLMLNAVGVESSIAWTNPRSRGGLIQEATNIERVSRLLVTAELDGTLNFLDPNDPDVPFGVVSPDLEGMNVLVLRKKEPFWSRLPETPARSSKRLAEVRLQVDAEGRLVGDGELRLSGNWAWRFLNWQDTPEEASRAWTDWLAERFVGFKIQQTTVMESVEDRKIEVAWSLRQRDEEVLGDEVSVAIARPLALKINPFTLEPGKRLTNVSLPFASSDEVRLTVNWPEGWEIDVKPEVRSMSTSVGKLRNVIGLDRDRRTLTLNRQFEVTKRRIGPRIGYRELREMFQTCVESDAQTLVLVRSK